MHPAFLMRSAIACALITASAANAQVFARAPSSARVGEAVQVVGEGFAQGSLVSIRITSPRQLVSKAAAVVSVDGMLTYSLIPTEPGGWAVLMFDASDRKAEVKLLAAP